MLHFKESTLKEEPDTALTVIIVLFSIYFISKTDLGVELLMSSF